MSIIFVSSRGARQVTDAVYPWKRGSIMFTFKGEFFPDPAKASLSEFYEGELAVFLHTLRRNGQLIEQHWNLVEQNGVVKLYCIAPDEDALEPRHYNRYGLEALGGLIQRSLRPPVFRVIGKTLGLSDACACESPSYYVLFSNFVAEYSPVSCGDCNLPVPLYKLPGDSEDEYYALRQWQGEYKACDSLFVLSGVGEGFGYREISEIESPLTKEGLEICREMSQKSKRPFYYFLHRHYVPQESTCPGCGQEWKLDGKLHGIYTFKCDQCRLLSDAP